MTAKPLFSPGDKVTLKPMSKLRNLVTEARIRKYKRRIGIVVSVRLSFWLAQRKLREYIYKVKFSDGKTISINERLLKRA